MKKKRGYLFIMLMFCFFLFACIYHYQKKQNLSQCFLSNVYIDEIKDDYLVVFQNGKKKKFFVKDAATKEKNCFADIWVEGTNAVKIKLKPESIIGKIIKIAGQVIELDGYGECIIQKNAVFYEKGSMKEVPKKDLHVGKRGIRFYFENGKICGGIIDEDEKMQQIRVLISTSNYKGRYHNKLVFTANGEYEIKARDKTERKKANEIVTIQKDSEYFKKSNWIRIQCEKQTDGIILKNVQRGEKNEPYLGTLYLRKNKKGISVINELDLEEYLPYVLCSEISDSYEMEALKAQAICIRTYALKQMENGAKEYEAYGANLDDSVMSQVYHNYAPRKRVREAVKETMGMAIYYRDKPIQAYFFSTSCGVTSDASIWKKKGEPYIKGKKLGKEIRGDLTREKEFSKFIKNDFDAYDSMQPFFRWRTVWEKDALQKKLEMQYRIKVGKIQRIQVQKRGTNGILEQIKIIGKSNSIKIKGELEIRKSLLLENQEICLKDGSKRTAQALAMLPSAYLSFENKKEKIYGYGGGYGHGVGVSQNAMNQMAKEGKKADEILEFFYDGIEIK